MSNGEFSDLYFDETDEFFDKEMQHVDRGEWSSLLDLYEQELEKMSEADAESASELRAKIQAARKRVYDDADEGEF
jgi:ElaB/YqjD/DUF883 family membrane-anchored ribosome-binding protein